MSNEAIAKASQGAVPKTVFSTLANLTLVAAGIALLAMTAIQSWQVFARYVLNQSPGWTEPLALIFLNTAMMCGAAVCVRNDRHFAFSLLQQNVGPRIRGALQKFSAALIALLGGSIAWGSGQLVLGDWTIPMAGTVLPEGSRYLPLSFGGVLIAVFALEKLFSRAATAQAKP
jgi:TRAP-type C4-dicarboxylate transport system permease small subunit